MGNNAMTSHFECTSVETKPISRVYSVLWFFVRPSVIFPDSGSSDSSMAVVFMMWTLIFMKLY